MTKKLMKKAKQKGQILLITVMLLATAITVVMTIAFTSTTETQMTKLEEESQKALAAAEAALEAAIQAKATVALSSLPAFDGTGITGQADVIERGGDEFVTPLLQRGEQYMFYLTDYDQETNTFSNPWSGGNLELFVQTEGESTCPALELTFIADTTNALTRHVANSCDTIFSYPDTTLTPTGETVKGVEFGYKTILSGISLQKILLVRVVNSPSRLGFKGAALKPQGRTISSEAKTTSGVTKKIELFQSYPQIPADFFV